jgi:hypothetical protein
VFKDQEIEQQLNQNEKDALWGQKHVSAKTVIIYRQLIALPDLV